MAINFRSIVKCNLDTKEIIKKENVETRSQKTVGSKIDYQVAVLREKIAITIFQLLSLHFWE